MGGTDLPCPWDRASQGRDGAQGMRGEGPPGRVARGQARATVQHLALLALRGGRARRPFAELAGRQSRGGSCGRGGAGGRLPQGRVSSLAGDDARHGSVAGQVGGRPWAQRGHLVAHGAPHALLLSCGGLAVAALIVDGGFRTTHVGRGSGCHDHTAVGLTVHRGFVTVSASVRRIGVVARRPGLLASYGLSKKGLDTSLKTTCTFQTQSV